MSALVANLEMFGAVAVLGLALILTAVSLLSYQRLRHPRALFIGLGFFAFALQGGYLVERAYALRGAEPWLLTVAASDLLVLLLLYLALRVR